MITDWSYSEKEKAGVLGDDEKRYTYNAGPGAVVQVEAGYWLAIYNSQNWGEWINPQNAMLVVEMKHRETTQEAEAKAIADPQQE